METKDKGIGSLFANDRKNGNQPDFEGTMVLGGRSYHAAVWDNGKKGLGLSLSEKTGEKSFREAGHGVLPPNDKTGNDKRPDYKGTLRIDGRPVVLSAWKKETKDNKPFLSIGASPAREKDRTPETERER